MSDPSHPVVASLYDTVMELPEAYFLRDHRGFLAEGLPGTVLDLGAGTGAQFEQFAKRADDTAALHAVEPDPHMRERARARAEELDLPVEIADARAESLPYDSDTFDTVVASLVFCTIPDAEAALDEVARVLAPGGEFRFLEHVRATGTTGLVHDAVAPGWHAVAGGCHLNRQTGDLFRRDDRFELTEYDRFDAGVSGAVPLIRGEMRRRDSNPLLSVLRPAFS